MKQYWFVMLKKGTKRDQSPEEAKLLQAVHMANIQTYASMGKLQIAGPFMDDGDWRGIFILDVPGRVAAETMFNDSGVRAVSCRSRRRSADHMADDDFMIGS